MVITIKLVKPSIHHLTQFSCACVLRICKVYSCRNFQVCDIPLLTIVTPLYIRVPRTYSSCQWKFVPFASISPFHPLPSPILFIFQGLSQPTSVKSSTEPYSVHPSLLIHMRGSSFLRPQGSIERKGNLQNRR